MIPRKMHKKLLEAAQKMPVVAIIGPRQSGKTTLAQQAFPSHKYVSLEDLKNREFAQEDPYSFFQTYENEFGIILDEIQNVPSLLSYIQVHADKFKRPGYFVLTGSQNILVLEAITQTLAGRISIFTLLPLSITELKEANLLPDTIESCVFKGLYPRIYDQNLTPVEWYPDYILTYLERDVRSIRSITDLSVFKRFLGLCAGRIGQLLNITSLANDCGITLATAKSWLSVLEASYIIYLFQPFHINVGKRLVKSPKLYFYDPGLACSLLAIESEEQLMMHYLRGGLVESFLLTDLFKLRYNQKLPPNLYFWRDKVGHEIDCMFISGSTYIPIEIKASKTPSQHFFDNVAYWYELIKTTEYNGIVIYAGSENQQRKYGRLLSWQSIDEVF